MYKRLFAAMLVFLLVAGLSAAQSDRSPKDVPSIYAMYETCEDQNCVLKSIWVMWNAPEKAPDSYRVSWTTTGKWRSIKKPNSKKAGNAIATELGYWIRRVKLPYGETLRVRVRAHYDGEKNGGWNCCLEFEYGKEFQKAGLVIHQGEGMHLIGQIGNWP